MKPVPNPCRRDCPKRSATCHCDCPDYEEYRQWRLWVYAENLKKKKEEDAFQENARRLFKKTTHYKGGKNR